MRTQCLALLIASVVVPFAMAKRVAPPVVRPVVLNGVEYSANGDGTHGWITATEVATKKKLWTAKVFRIHTYWWKGEEDNQWIYIPALRLEQNGLFVKDERSRCYSLDLNTRRVHKERCH
jgi:hypothetical protein